MTEDEPVFTPIDFVRHVARNRKVAAGRIRVPRRLLITYQRQTYEQAKSLIHGKPLDWWPYRESQPFCVGEYQSVEIGVGRIWIGAPAAVMTFEEMIACGAEATFEVGLSGSLQESLQPGHIVVVTEGIRDEGTSYHYLPPETRVESSKRLRNKLIKHLNEETIGYSVGSVWSTDGVYRETRSKFRKFRNIGVLAVNMETSAIFAVAKYRNIEAASAQVISDVLTDAGWLQAWDHRSVREGVIVLLRAVLKSLSET